jgi:hypothetical protein
VPIYHCHQDGLLSKRYLELVGQVDLGELVPDLGDEEVVKAEEDEVVKAVEEELEAVELKEVEVEVNGQELGGITVGFLVLTVKISILAIFNINFKTLLIHVPNC